MTAFVIVPAAAHVDFPPGSPFVQVNPFLLAVMCDRYQGASYVEAQLEATGGSMTAFIGLLNDIVHELRELLEHTDAGLVQTGQANKTPPAGGGP